MLISKNCSLYLVNKNIIISNIELSLSCSSDFLNTNLNSLNNLGLESFHNLYDRIFFILLTQGHQVLDIGLEDSLDLSLRGPQVVLDGLFVLFELGLFAFLELELFLELGDGLLVLVLLG